MKMVPMEQIRVYGRYVYMASALWMASSLCEAGFRLTGASYLRLRLKADDTVTDPDRRHLTPRYAIRLDGSLIRDAHMEAPEETVPVFEGAEPRDAEVRLIKLSECTQSILALTDIQTDGRLSPLPARDRRISFIGDSITCGYGVEAQDGLVPFSTFTENAEKSYAALVSNALEMDRELACFSGHGIISGFTGDPSQRNTSELVPLYYEKVGRNGFQLPDGHHLEDLPWDFSVFQPDWIVLNLGTNDLSWCQEDVQRKALYGQEYIRFLKTVRGHNPRAEILCVLGVMGTGLNQTMEQAVKAYQEETGDARIHVLLLSEQDGAKNGFGADFHPSEVTQRLLAERVTEEIQALCTAAQR